VRAPQLCLELSLPVRLTHCLDASGILGETVIVEARDDFVKRLARLRGVDRAG
jgi:hypothetical protein